jgi:hypothetical protein
LAPRPSQSRQRVANTKRHCLESRTRLHHESCATTGVLQPCCGQLQLILDETKLPAQRATDWSSRLQVALGSACTSIATTTTTPHNAHPLAAGIRRDDPNRASESESRLGHMERTWSSTALFVCWLLGCKPRRKHEGRWKMEDVRCVLCSTKSQAACPRGGCFLFCAAYHSLYMVCVDSTSRLSISYMPYALYQ